MSGVGTGLRPSKRQDDRKRRFSLDKRPSRLRRAGTMAGPRRRTRPERANSHAGALVSAQQFGVSDWVDFTGFVPQADVARHLAGALCLLLPSVEEQWGLVVNEALAFSLPLILAENVGAIDLLAAQDQNAFILEANDRDGWAKAMASLGSNQSLWSRMVSHSASLAPLGDVSEFVRGVFPHLPFPLN